MVIDGAQCPKIALLGLVYQLAEVQFEVYPNFQTVSEELFSETPIPPVASPNPLWRAPLQHLSIVTSVYAHINLEDCYELGRGKGRPGVTMAPLRAYAKKNSPEGLRVEEGVRRRFRKSEGVRT
jgi:hypothetical protein